MTSANPDPSQIPLEEDQTFRKQMDGDGSSFPAAAEAELVL